LGKEILEVGLNGEGMQYR
jgi:hypothetical protein